MRTAERIEVTGVVQGVGFRPFVHRLATELGLDGHVGNDSSQVFIEVAGPRERIDTFVSRLASDAPPLAWIETIERATSSNGSDDGFRIVDSTGAAGGRTLVPPDTAVCTDCLVELHDPNDRRHGHPFITCTNCGPRFTIVTSVPYDRPNTTMAEFEMCPRCRAEYIDPLDRRYHAQPIACPDCGPTLVFRDGNGQPADRADPIAAAGEALEAGLVVAIKGLGGHHLACSGTGDAAVRELRNRKHRPEKPFAVMVRDLEAARSIAHVDRAEAVLLTSAAAPIVLLRRRATDGLSPLVAPGNPFVGVMLPYTPVHHLLFTYRSAPLVMTSGNRAGEPIAYGADALRHLGGLFDVALDHDRPIHVHCDDSVVRVVDGRLLPIRRARGYAPIPVAFGGDRTVLAVGGELKNTVCVASTSHAWVSQHIGDHENLETQRSFEAIARQFSEIYAVEPDVVAADAHPGYMSSRWARTHHLGRLVEVQHHHAHVASVMAERGLDPATPVIGFAFDGTGYGDDGTIWGGEALVANAFGYRRASHLEPIPLPGGDAAVRHPSRIALAHLWSADIEWSPDLPPVANTPASELTLLRQQLDRGFRCVPTTSMGRLFDAVASLVGLRHSISFEAQAAIDLEIAAQEAGPVAGTYAFDLADRQIVARHVLHEIVDDLATGVAPGVIARRFHDGVVDVIYRLADAIRHTDRIETVVLSGGVFQNALLTSLAIRRLDAAGFTVLTHSIVPPNDGGLALGQAFIAAHADRSADPTEEV